MLSILKYQELHNAIITSQGNDVRQAYNILSILTGKSVEEYRTMKWSDFISEQNKIEIPSLELKADNMVSEFEVNGETFKVVQFATDWNFEQFSNMSNLTRDENSIIDNLHLILSVLCYKDKNEDVSLTEFDRRSKLFQEYLNVEIAYPIGFFFAVFLAKLSQSTQYYSHVEKMKRLAMRLRRKKELDGLKKNGGGMRQWINYLLMK